MGRAIVLGLGNCVDYEAVWDASAVERLAAECSVEPHEADATRPIESARDLVITLLGFLRTGVGGERFVPSRDAVLKVADAFETVVTVGGTSLRAANCMRKLGYASALHLVTLNRHVRARLPAGCEWVCSEEEGEVYPHLIVQFPVGAAVRVGRETLVARRADRIIYVHDPQNARLRISPKLADLCSDARVFLISGLNAIRDGRILADRLAQLRDVLDSIPAEAIVFYEDAGYHEEALGRRVIEELADRIDAFSLNETELQQRLGRRVDLLDPIDTLDGLTRLHCTVPVRWLVLHTSAYALAHGSGAGRFLGALRGGVAMACTRVRLGDEFDRRDVCTTKSMPVRTDGAQFADAIHALGGDRVSCVPSVRLAGDAVTTVGLGDAFVGGFLPALLDAEAGIKRFPPHGLQGGAT